MIVLHVQEMKIAILILTILSSSTVFAVEWREAVDQMIEKHEASKADPKPTVYPELAERIRALFPDNQPIKINIASVDNGECKDMYTIYIAGANIEIVGHGGNLNLSTGAEHIYQWKTGASEGLELSRDDFQLASYLYYITDPSLIMASFYDKYIRYKHLFEEKPNIEDGWKEVILQDSYYGFEALYISEKPLWFHGYRVFRDEKTWEYIVSKPEPLEEIPEEILRRKDQISFEPSNLTLERHMRYL